MKVTQWFDGKVKPVHVGVYQRAINSGIRYSYWDGRVWSVMSRTASLAWKLKSFKSVFQRKPWRGVVLEQWKGEKK